MSAPRGPSPIIPHLRRPQRRSTRAPEESGKELVRAPPRPDNPKGSDSTMCAEAFREKRSERRDSRSPGVLGSCGVERDEGRFGLRLTADPRVLANPTAARVPTRTQRRIRVRGAPFRQRVARGVGGRAVLSIERSQMMLDREADERGQRVGCLIMKLARKSAARRRGVPRVFGGLRAVGALAGSRHSREPGVERECLAPMVRRSARGRRPVARACCLARPNTTPPDLVSFRSGRDVRAFVGVPPFRVGPRATIRPPARPYSHRGAKPGPIHCHGCQYASPRAVSGLCAHAANSQPRLAFRSRLSRVRFLLNPRQTLSLVERRPVSSTLRRRPQGGRHPRARVARRRPWVGVR